MKRLTKRIGHNVYYTMGAYPETTPAECDTKDIRQILRHLANYEDTGLAPEEIICGAPLSPAKTLTLEKLVQMDTKPVWVEDLLIPSCSAWHLCCDIHDEIWLFDSLSIEDKVAGYNATTGDGYGKTWLAYDREPEEGNAG